MIFLLCVIFYIVAMAGSMLALCYLNGRYKSIDKWDFAGASIIASLFWPIGFPLTAAYIVGTAMSEQ
jgi:hypothetical protein